MKLSVVILNYNVRYFLELCLKSVEASLVHIDAEIIVVDNQSSDDSCLMVKTMFPKVKLIENKDNFGFSKGNNIAVAEAIGEYVCILNPDTVVAENTFEDLLQFADQQSNLGILGCRLIDGQGRFLPESKRNVPRPLIAIKKMLGFSKSYYTSDLNEKSIGNASVFVGAFMLMKRDIYNQVQGFDEDYFMYGEDIDLSYKVEQAEYNNTYNGKVAIIHFKGESTLKDQAYANRFYGAMQIFYNKHFKSNVVFDALVWIGIKLGASFLKPSEKVHVNPKQYILVGSQPNPLLENVLQQKLACRQQIDTYEDNTEYILDNNYLSFKSIIEILSDTPKNCSATFKILPKNSNFIIGSNSSKTRGAVIQLS
ncbi:glycosyltransferase family 2 protein [Psychroserpens mesophilus]|uniref:glycosyltransferase family 2 protein n=1 Tax=Psychroserpens mesophilus TaxID=325473 RepID=UPI00058D7CA8|nr:glycosyltransferase family 2 protein [Psychroserpens mesophilus]